MSNESSRGHSADKPRDIPAQGWKDIALRVKDQLNYDHVQVVSAGVAFYFFLALFPALAAAVSIYGLLVSPEQVEQQMSQLTSALPEQAHQMISEILHQLAGESDSNLGWTLVISILLSLYSANKGIAAVFEGVNIAYDELDERGFLKKNGIELLFTLGAIVVGLLAIAIIGAWPGMVGNLGLPSVLQTLISWGRWIVLALIISLSLGLIYKVAPDRDNPEFKWVSWGAGIATLLWIGGSLLFSWYVNNFGSYDETYGSFAAIVILMLWFFLTAYIIILGAEINSEMEHQTRKDTTTGEDEPMGQRNAFHADNVAGSSKEKERKH
jgi:membrane protein